MAHEGLWEQLDKLDHKTTARRAKCEYLEDPPRYVISLLNTEYVAYLCDKQIFSTQSSPESTPAGFIEQLCLLAYLINVKEVPPANKFVKVENLPSGQFFFRGLHSLPTEKLEEAFGKSPELLYEASEQLDGKKREFGDASIELYGLPRIPIQIIIWGSDEEFDARASILFDQTAGNHIPLDALGALANLAVEALVKAPE
jgi:hypothetical protein